MRAGEPGAARSICITIVGSTATDLGLDPPALGHAIELPLQPSIERPLVKALAASRIVILALDGRGFTREARAVCFLAWHLLGRLPLLVQASPPGDAISATTRQAATDYAAILGTVVPVVLHDVATLGPAVAQVIQHDHSERAVEPFRMELTQGDPTDRSFASGAVVCGSVRPGLDVVALPSATRATVTHVAGEPSGEATLRLDKALASPSDVVLAAADARPELADQVAAHIVWLDGDAPLLPGRSYRLRLSGQSAQAQISALKHRVDPADLHHIAARRLEAGETGLCNVAFNAPLVFDQITPASRTVPALACFTLEHVATGATVGVGRIAFTLRRATNIHWQALAVDKMARAELKGQRPCCLWLTGLSGSGKSTIASLLEKRLSATGRHTYTLDGDNVRHGLNRDLGFTDADRVENIRRVAEVSKLFVDAGLIVMVSFISPFRAERDMARSLFAAGEFLELYVDTPIEVCEQRDPKGLYRKARAGQLKNFTGIDSAYEAPEHPEIRLRSGEQPAEALVEQVLRALSDRGMVGPIA
jgi:bifunctional enzyme CysN/CysC